jgi:cytochrome c-type biogenesis protein CcmH/NrfF
MALPPEEIAKIPEVDVPERIPFARARALRAAFALVVCLLAAGPAAASTEPEGWAYDLANEMMSPFCPGRTLAECPSSQAGELRVWLLVQEAAGRSREDVEAELYDRFGDVILAAPRAEGFGITAYAFPIIAFLAGGVLVAVFLRRQTSAAATASRPPPDAEAASGDAELERIVDEELAR